MTPQEWDKKRVSGSLNDIDIATILIEWASREKEFETLTQRLENNVCDLAKRAAANETLLKQDLPY